MRALTNPWPGGANARWWPLVAALLAVTPVVHAEFAVALSPPRFELQLKAGETSRNAIAISNAGSRVSTYSIKTADWTYAANGNVEFSDTLQSASCRPWVAIERRQLTVLPGGQYRFRFEVTPPTDAPAAECRFAILIEGQEESAEANSISVPYSARMAVIVYVGVGGAQPRMSVGSSAVQMIDGRLTAVLKVRNDGDAHGRLDGYLSGKDATGEELEFAPTSSPILPGETRTIPLLATRPGDPDTPVAVQLPVTVKGNLESSNGQKIPLDLHLPQ